MTIKNKVVTDEQYGKVARRANEVILRFGKGVLDFENTLKGLQLVAEGIIEVKPVREESKENWIQNVLTKERQYHLTFFGTGYDLSEFEKTLKKYGKQQIKRWKKLGLEPHFLPKVDMYQDNDYCPGWKVKPENWFYKQAKKGNILRNVNGELMVNQNASILEGITVLIDTRLKPQYNNGKQMYKNDNLLGSIIKRLRKERKIIEYEHRPQNSRFGVSANEWEEHIKSALAQKLDIEIGRVRLERVIEANTIPQIYTDMLRKDDGETDTWVWYEEFFGGRGDRLFDGFSDYGGLANGYYYSSGLHWNNRSFRPLAVL